MDGFFRRLGRTVVRWRRVVLVVWAALLVAGVFLAPRLSSVFEREQVTGGVGDSDRAMRIERDEFGHGGALFSQVLVIRGDGVGAQDPAYRSAAAALLDAARSTGDLAGVRSYLDSADPTMVNGDGSTTYAYLDLATSSFEAGNKAAKRVMDAVKAAPRPPWLEAYVTGDLASHSETMEISERSLIRAEVIGVPVALVVLVFVFGALVAAGLPLLIGLLSIVLTLGGAFLIGQLLPLSVFMENVATMIGLGVGIDYSLFVLNRYRFERGRGLPTADAAVETVSHAGKAIAFSGLAVMIGLSTLLVPQSALLQSMAIGGMLAVFIAVLAAISLLPALLVFTDRALDWPHQLSDRLHRLTLGGFWQRWATAVMRQPVRFIVVSVALLGVLAVPALELRTGDAGLRTLGENAQSRRGYDLLAEKFGAGRIAPVEIVVDAHGPASSPQVMEAVYDLGQVLAADRRVAEVRSYVRANDEWRLDDYRRLYADGFDGLPVEARRELGRVVNLDSGADKALVMAVPRTATESAVQSEEAEGLVRDLRSRIIPSVPGLAGHRVLVGGSTAFQTDLRNELYGKFPWVVGLVLAATFVLLTVLFRSLLIPLKAVLMNLLSVFAAYGFLTLVFQWGWGEPLLRFQSLGFIDWFAPIMLFTILFGLSMDYEVFLLSRVRELHDRGLSTEEAVALGLERTGGVVTGAALIMIVIFAAFSLSPIIVIKELGLGLAVAILLDATIIRVLLVPALMRVFGDWNWWLPGPLRRLLPRVTLEREAVAYGSTTGWAHSIGAAASASSGRPRHRTSTGERE